MPRIKSVTAASGATSPSIDSYRIAAVAKLTAIAVPTIRMWERRYGAVKPGRSAANGRLYSRADIDRFILLKAVVDAGHAISTVAQLDESQLQARLNESAGQGAKAALQPSRVLVCGVVLARRLEKAWAGRSDLQIVHTLKHLSDETSHLVGSVDAIIVEVATLSLLKSRELRQLRQQAQPRVTIVVYGFGNRQTLARLDQEGILALALPTAPAHLARICLLSSASQAVGNANSELQTSLQLNARRYDEAFLEMVAELPTTVRCECPHHLGELLTKLNAFEQYSLECENSNTADAAIHGMLHTAAAQCRQRLEQALQIVLAHEGIADPTAPPAPMASRR